MSRNYLEQRIIKAGIELGERNVEVKGAPITADSIRMLRVKSMPPGVQAMYSIIGLLMVGVSIWIYTEVPHNMMISLVMMIGGVGNLVFAGNGKPKQVSQLEDKIDLMDLTGEIVNQFVKKMDEDRGSKG